MEAVMQSCSAPAGAMSAEAIFWQPRVLSLPEADAPAISRFLRNYRRSTVLARNRFVLHRSPDPRAADTRRECITANSTVF